LTAAPPQDLDAEAAVLGSCLLFGARGVRAAAEEGLRPDDFYREQHAVVFAAMVRLEDRGEEVDHLTVIGQLRSEQKLTAAGGRAGVEMHAASAPEAGNIRQYARMVVESAKWRGRQVAGRRQLQAVETRDEDEWTAAVADADAADRGAMESIVDPADDFMAWYQSDRRGLPTPFEELTRAIGGGFLPGETSVLGGWPGFGKTVFGDQCVLKAREAGARCHVYVSEMQTAARTARMVARMSGVPWHAIRDRKANSDQWRRMIKVLPDLPATYDMIAGWPVERLCRHIRRNGWDFCIVDSASRIPHRDTQELARASGALADVAMQTGCHIILVVQLNLERAKGAVRPSPTGRDLLGTGAWFQDARNVLFVHRAQRVEKDGGEERAIALNHGHVYADKATHGEPAQSWVAVTFDTARMRYVERETAASSNGSLTHPKDAKGEEMVF
jgi:replicative DNA helicase